MRTLTVVGTVMLIASCACAAPRVWLQHTDVPQALMASSGGVEMPGCKAEWAIRYDDGRHYTEIAIVDLPAEGAAKVSDCQDWWDPRRSKSMDVSLKLYDPDGQVLAEQSYVGVFKFVARRGLPTEGWSATASRGANTAAAYDADPGTRWDTGGRQEAGDWYVLDMGSPQEFAGLIIDTRWSANDYPEGLSVSASDDGGQWTSVVEIGDTEPLNQQGKITLRFDRVAARYIKLTLTKPHGDRWFWSIHELSVLPPEHE